MRKKLIILSGFLGSGKTTLLRCLNFLERPDGGVIRVEGRPCLTLRTLQLCRRARSAESVFTSGWYSSLLTCFPSIRQRRT
mgnify:CR=1 FL=1